MSTLKAEVVSVVVEPHPNADRLDLCRVKGWQCVAQKGQYQTGDLAVYIPIDSVLTPELVAKLGIEKFYHKRIKTLKLRGFISQGMLAPLSIIPLDSAVVSQSSVDGGMRARAEGLDVTEALGITKYEEPIPVSMSGKIIPDEPGMVKYTDIENIKNFPGLFAPDEAVVVREKIHGSNFRAYKRGGHLFVGSHRCNLVRDEGNLYWRAAALLSLEEKLLEGEEVFAEVYGSGVQDLAYGCKPGEIGASVFDILRDGQYLKDADLTRECLDRGWPTAPLIHAGPFSGFSMPKKSYLADQIIEGVVIRPPSEKYSVSLQGRTILKSLSDEYLLRKDGTERH